jgi:excinuclease UvrABC helicase subunit UvrB
MGKPIWDHDAVGRLLARLKGLDAQEPRMRATRSLAQTAGGAARAAEAQAFAKTMRDHLLAAVESGANTDRKIMAAFNRLGLRTRTGERWTKSAVTTLRVRLGVKRFSD